MGHVEAGLRTGDLQAPWPEELNRRLTDQMSDMHFAPTTTAQQNLRTSGIENKTIIIEVELGELPEQTYVKTNSSKKEKKIYEEVIKSLGITIKENNQSKGVTVTKVDNEQIKLEIGDIILEVNREIVASINSFTSLVEKYKETGRSSLLLKIQKGKETSWVTIKFINN